MSDKKEAGQDGDAPAMVCVYNKDGDCKTVAPDEAEKLLKGKTWADSPAAFPKKESK